MRLQSVFIFTLTLVSVLTRGTDGDKDSQKYIIRYFNLAALGESPRFLASYGNLNWEDIRINFDQWEPLKPKMPYGKVPTIELNGKVSHQSVAISRYLAKQVNLTGDNDWEDLEIDAVVDTITDLRVQIVDYGYELDPILKEKKKKPLFNVTIPFYLGRLEAQVEKNNGYLATGKLTWADLLFVSLLDYLNDNANKDIIADHAALKKLQQRVLEIPNIKKWIEKRPPVEFNSLHEELLRKYKLSLSQQ